MTAETVRLPIGRLLPPTSEEAADLLDVEAAGLGLVVELEPEPEVVEPLEDAELPTRDASAGTLLKLALTELPLVQEEPGVVLAPATKLTAAHWQQQSAGEASW
jgi:hypothetical protein